MVIMVSLLTRRLREGKTYEDFRKAWYHTVGFGTPNRMYTMLNIADTREIIVFGISDSDIDNLIDGLRIDIKERKTHPLDEVIEPNIGRKFAVLISEDDFSKDGLIEYAEPSINGEKTNVPEIMENIEKINAIFNQAQQERDFGKGII